MCEFVVIFLKFLSFSAINLHKSSPSSTVKDLNLKNILIKRVKDHESVAKYCRSKEKSNYKLNILTFADARKTNNKGK